MAVCNPRDHDLLIVDANIYSGKDVFADEFGQDLAIGPLDIPSQGPFDRPVIRIGPGGIKSFSLKMRNDLLQQMLVQDDIYPILSIRLLASNGEIGLMRDLAGLFETERHEDLFEPVVVTKVGTKLVGPKRH